MLVVHFVVKLLHVLNLRHNQVFNICKYFCFSFTSHWYCSCPAGSSHKPFECRPGVQADLVLLVDGSWSIGRTNFKKVREFLEGLVTPFHIGLYGVQIGEPGLVTVYTTYFISITTASWKLCFEWFVHKVCTNNPRKLLRRGSTEK